MKTVLKIAGIVVVVLLAVIVIGLAYLMLSFPKVDQPADITIESTPERIDRGKYLANHVAVCIDCHSTRDWSYFSGPIVPGTEGKGGEEFKEAVGTLYPSNITPAGIGDWTDGEIVRAITSGVNKEGKALFPLMPYQNYSQMAEEDVYSIVAYIKTLKPIPNEVPQSKLNFPMNLIVRTIPKPVNLQPLPNINDSVAYGKYLATISGCIFCHTPAEKGKPVEGMELAGGFEFAMPWGIVRSANITPDSETGVGEWSKQEFIDRFTEYRPPDMQKIPVKDSNTVMPWIMYAGMTNEDLEAIFTFLQSVKPVKHSVERYSNFK